MIQKTVTFLGIFAIILLAGCATFAPTPSTQKVLPWPQRQTQLKNIHNWTLQSAFSIRQQNHVAIASLLWQQQGKRYYQIISGPFNLGAVRIIGEPGRVVLQKSSQQQITASSPEELMQQEFGWQLPISNLYYWVRGLPVPYWAVTQEQFDTAQHLTAMEQQGWQIQYLNFTTVNGIDLPTTILLNNPQWQVKMVIKGWQI